MHRWCAKDSSVGLQYTAAAIVDADTVLLVLPNRSFDRSASDVQLLAAWLVKHCCPFFSSMPQDVVQHLCTLVGEREQTDCFACATAHVVHIQHSSREV